MTDQVPVATRRPRSDAVRNRSRVSDTAMEVFAERGLDATVAEVAERANVGNATVYRHFPTKSDLLAEVATRWLDEWGAELGRRLAAEGGDDALRAVIQELFERLRRNRFALDLLRAGNLDQRMTEARAGVERLFTEALWRAARAGAIDPGVTYADMSVLVLGLTGRLSDMGDTDPVAWRRMADYTWAAIAR